MYNKCEYTLQPLTFKNPCCDPNPDSNEPVDPDPDQGTQRWPIRLKIKKVQVLKCLLFFLKDI
jgi:hypothetical protein